jgi:hypothetical protein
VDADPEPVVQGALPVAERLRVLERGGDVDVGRPVMGEPRAELVAERGIGSRQIEVHRGRA